jgi:hypothetical protein
MLRRLISRRRVFAQASRNHRAKNAMRYSRAHRQMLMRKIFNARRQMRKAEDNKVFVIKGLSPNEYHDLKIAGTKVPLAESTMRTLGRVMNFGLSRGIATIYGAYNQHNTLCAAAFFIFAGKRVTYLNAVSNEQGKTTNAMHKIIDQFIQENAGRKLTLDFEGSIIEGIARFYKGFGAQLEQYYCLKSNRLPLPLRWFKK